MSTGARSSAKHAVRGHSIPAPALPAPLHASPDATWTAQAASAPAARILTNPPGLSAKNAAREGTFFPFRKLQIASAVRE
ncbi:hypothetical protein [Stappia sp.]|uniref:hypothetical protein n=1 Tax=Stappia sp. TaxID=1870903 RepID=UPI0032D8ED4D